MPFTAPFARTSWELVAGHTVLVNIDDQNDFLHPDGWYERSGVDISHMRRVIEPTKVLVDAARRAGMPIVWTRHGFRDERDAGIFVNLRPFLRAGGLRIGTWGHEILAELAPQPEDWLVDKNRLSAFYNTNLELVLRSLGAQTVVFTGVLTNQCVSASSKDASFRDLAPIVVEECTGTTLPHLHEPALEMISVGWGQVSTLDEILGQLRRLDAAEPQVEIALAAPKRDA
jgi:nicotinamidase-related amidase